LQEFLLTYHQSSLVCILCWAALCNASHDQELYAHESYSESKIPIITIITINFTSFSNIFFVDISCMHSLTILTICGFEFYLPIEGLLYGIVGKFLQPMICSLKTKLIILQYSASKPSIYLQSRCTNSVRTNLTFH
jgi:hypothetical protein